MPCAGFRCSNVAPSLAKAPLISVQRRLGLTFCSLSSNPATPVIDSESNGGDAEVNSLTKRRKQPMCLHFGFVGDDFHGLEFTQPDVRTVELELSKALHACGFISDQNYVDGSMLKIGWNKACRTDKGVHAVGAAASGKLLVAPNQVQAGAGARGLQYGHLKPTEIAQLNAVLPQDVRVFSGMRVRNSFKALQACSARKYEYLLPESWLGGAGVAALNALLQVFEGSHHFHNFCGYGSDGARARKEARRRAQEMSQKVSQGMSRGGSRGDQGVGAGAWPLAIAPTMNDLSHVRTVYRAEASEAVEVGGQRFWVVQVQGQGFMQHQIRRMLGAAICALHGRIPAQVLETALQGPFAVPHIPRAPGFPLVMEECQFFHPRTDAEDFEVTISETGQQAMQQYKEEVLYPHICRLHQHFDLDQWLRRQSALDGLAWSDLQDTFDAWRDERHTERRRHQEERRQQGHRKRQTPEQVRLPRGWQTAVCNKLRILPGPQVHRAKRQLLDQLSSGELSRDHPMEHFVHLAEAIINSSSSS